MSDNFCVEDCSNIGHCCKGFHLTLPYLSDSTETWIEAFAKMSDLGMPFYPLEKNVKRDQHFKWTFACQNLKEDGLCSHYEYRPQTCRIYKPKQDQLCCEFEEE